MSDHPDLFDKATSKLEQRFWTFFSANPNVYKLFKQFAFQAINFGHDHLSADLIMHKVRWETSVKTSEPDFKINNNHVAYYARKFMDDFPQHEGFFRTRTVEGEAA